VVVSFVRDFGSIPQGSRLEFRAGGNQHVRAFLPVRPVAAEVVAVDQRNRPVLLERAAGGGGRTVLSPIRSSSWRRRRPGSTPSPPGASTTPWPPWPASTVR
jgi:hypothetical protein